MVMAVDLLFGGRAVLRIITILPKGNKPRDFLKNRRPISLLNTTYKLFSGVIANRLKRVLNKATHLACKHNHRMRIFQFCKMFFHYKTSNPSQSHNIRQTYP